MSAEFVIADTEYGRVKGLKKKTALEMEYLSFLGIPYAEPPIGKLRFKDAKKPKSWSDVYDATEERSRFIGFDNLVKAIVGSEDGLFVNIFTKNLKPDKLYPVIVYIYGGAFQGGNSSLDVYSPDYFLMADVILVTFNYRVGALGFLHLNDPELNVPGNAGLKDQLLVLKFVRDNIVNFGGDPNNVTLAGHSAGGGSVSYHCCAESSRNLFHRAIIMSGCVLNVDWAQTPRRDWALRLAKAIDYDGDENNERELLDFLQTADAVKIIEVSKKLLKPDEIGKITFVFAPHIEPYVTPNTFVSMKPIDLVRNAWSNDIDILIGGTSDEGLLYLQHIREMPALLASFKLENTVPVDIQELSADDPIRINFAKKLHQTYYSSSSVADPTKDELAFCKLHTDKVFLHGLQRIVQGRQNSGGKGKTYLYRFAVDSSTQNFYKITRLAPAVPHGVCHADEMSYLFKNKQQRVPERSSVEFKSIERFISVFTSFASTGNPNSNVIDADMESVEWKPVDSREPPFKCLNIEEHLKFEVWPETERLAIWNELYRETKTPLY